MLSPAGKGSHEAVGVKPRPFFRSSILFVQLSMAASRFSKFRMRSCSNFLTDSRVLSARHLSSLHAAASSSLPSLWGCGGGCVRLHHKGC
jgi:hypothetical protein